MSPPDGSVSGAGGLPEGGSSPDGSAPVAADLPEGLRPHGGRPAGAPELSDALPPRSRGVIGLLEENCTVCMLCARECPDWCIHIEGHAEVVPARAERGRPVRRNVLDRFAIDFSLCMYCGICVDVCPFDALFWAPEFGYADDQPAALVHERDQLRSWMWQVPPPPPSDPDGGPAAEVLAADRARGRAGG